MAPDRVSLVRLAVEEVALLEPRMATCSSPIKRR